LNQFAADQRARQRRQKRRAGGNGEDVGDGQGGLGGGLEEAPFVTRGAGEGKRGAELQTRSLSASGAERLDSPSSA
jgi:hypothetical protein